MKSIFITVAALSTLLASTSSFAQDYYSREQLMSISRASQPMGRIAIAEGSIGHFGVQFGPQEISWLVVVAPTGRNRRGRVHCQIGNVSIRSQGQLIYPSLVGQLPAHNGVQAYYRINQGYGRFTEGVSVAITGNTFIHNVCPVHVHAVVGEFHPHNGRFE